MADKKPVLLPGQIIEGIEGRIYSLRGQRVMLSHDLAALYQVETRTLMQAVQRNADRFPGDFAFKLTNQEVENLKSQIVISSWGGSRKAPHAFTEQGVAMLSSVLKSSHAVGVNIEIMRSFVKLRSMLESNKELAQKLAKLEQKYDAQFKAVFEAIRELMSPPPTRKRRIGFVQEE
ncbi:MAG: ORF6N domain-containing protein [Nitrosomonadales bacterium]|nr:ORF6N domain-containing protein [Nitrosomonadales bacterium]